IMNFDDVYESQVMIGQGGFGSVWIAFDKQNNKKVAIKKIKLFQKDGKLDHGNIYSIHHEISAMKDLSKKEDNIYIHIYYNSFILDNEYVVVMEYIEGVEINKLMTIFYQKDGRIPDNFFEKFTIWLYDALDFIHTNKWAHRDIKPENIKYDNINNR